LRLVIGGGEFKLGWDHKATPNNEKAEKLLALIKELKLFHRVTFTGFIETQHLPVIYKYAQAFIHLSKYEGFGLNVIEPQLIGTPVVAADKSSYPEVLEDSAILVDPSRTKEVATQLAKLIAEDKSAEKFRNDLIKKGKSNVSRFSWAKSAQTLLQEIKKVKQEKEERKAKQTAGNKKSEKSVMGKNKERSEALEKSEKQLKKAVVIATYFHPFVGGMEQVALDYAKFLVKIGYEVTVLTSDRKLGQVVVKKEEELTWTENGGKYKLQIQRLQRSGRNYYFYRLKGLLRELKIIKPDLIHAHGFGFPHHDFSILSYKVTNKKTVKVINTPHGPFMSKPERGIRATFKVAWNFMQSLYLNRILDIVIAVNPSQFRWIKNTYRIAEHKIRLLTPLMPQPTKSWQQLHKLRSKKGYISISSLSRLADYKGFEDIIAAFNEINTAANTKLLIAGKTDNFAKEISDLIKASPRRDDIKLEKDISEERRNEILAETDIFIFASQWEAFGIVLAEAMSYGSAIVSTTTEGGRFLVEPNKNGLLFDYKDLPKLIEHINYLINNQKVLRDMQEKSLRSVQKYSEEKMFKRYSKLIEEIGN
jgi:glycosyltransferase involved in cell wall biosynthesis